MKDERRATKAQLQAIWKLWNEAADPYDELTDKRESSRRLVAFLRHKLNKPLPHGGRSMSVYDAMRVFDHSWLLGRQAQRAKIARLITEYPETRDAQRKAYNLTTDERCKARLGYRLWPDTIEELVEEECAVDEPTRLTKLNKDQLHRIYKAIDRAKQGIEMVMAKLNKDTKREHLT